MQASIGRSRLRIEKIEYSERSELELTLAIQKVIEWNLEVFGLILDESYKWLDIGTPESYCKAINYSYSFSLLKE